MNVCTTEAMNETAFCREFFLNHEISSFPNSTLKNVLEKSNPTYVNEKINLPNACLFFNDCY